MSTSAAARMLGLKSAQSIRDYLAAGTLEGDTSAKPFRVSRASVDERLAKLGPRSDTPELAGVQATPPPSELALRIELLEREFKTTRAALAEVSAQRDRFRAEAASLRAVALRLSAGVRDASASFRQGLAELESAQGETLAALLAPFTPEDIPPRADGP